MVRRNVIIPYFVTEDHSGIKGVFTWFKALLSVHSLNQANGTLGLLIEQAKLWYRF
jgi:hypothetical protein